MQHIRHLLLGFLLIGGWIPQTVLSKTIKLVNPSGECVEFDVAETDQFLDVLTCIQSYFQEDAFRRTENLEPIAAESTVEGIPLHHSQFDFVISHAGLVIRAKKENVRNYEVSVKKEEKKDLAYIITALAYDSLISIATSTSSINKAGKRIDHLHPYRFLMTIFTDQELIAAAHAIRDRGGLPWSGFLDGITGSLTNEAAHDNLLQYTSDFASKVKIDPALILPLLKSGKWTEFVNVLIDKIPREIDPNRYDM